MKIKQSNEKNQSFYFVTNIYYQKNVNNASANSQENSFDKKLFNHLKYIILDILLILLLILIIHDAYALLFLHIAFKHLWCNIYFKYIKLALSLFQ